MYVVIFASTGNALLRPSRMPWSTIQDMLDRVEYDGVTGPSWDSAMYQAREFHPGSSRLIAVPYDEWRAGYAT